MFLILLPSAILGLSLYNTSIYLAFSALILIIDASS